jgi:hypothetical protein
MVADGGEEVAEPAQDVGESAGEMRERDSQFRVVFDAIRELMAPRIPARDSALQRRRKNLPYMQPARTPRSEWFSFPSRLAQLSRSIETVERVAVRQRCRAVLDASGLPDLPDVP